MTAQPASFFEQFFGRVPEGPEDRALGERCILGFNSGPPMLPSAYNNNVHLLQTPDHVVILNEMVHNARVVPLNGEPHLPPAVKQWVGDTLVVDMTNFLGQTSFHPGRRPSTGAGERAGPNVRLALTRLGVVTARHITEDVPYHACEGIGARALRRRRPPGRWLRCLADPATVQAPRRSSRR
jgi:hypothetical protein